MIEQIQFSPGIGLSDHLVLCFNYTCYIEENVRLDPHLNYNKGNYVQIIEELSDMNWEQSIHGKNVEDTWDILAEQIIKSIEQNIPVSRMTQGCARPPIDHKAIQSLKNKRTKWVKYQNCKKPYHV